MTLKHKLFFLATPMVIIGMAYIYFRPHYHTPKLNQNPKYFLTVQGHIASKFHNWGHLVLIATYDATKDPCFHDYNPLVGLATSESRTHYYFIKPDKNNHYKVKIPFDKYEPGLCGWISTGLTIGFAKNKKDVASMAFVAMDGDKDSEKLNPKSITYICNKPDILNCNIKLKKNTIPVVSLRPKESYKINVNIQYSPKT